MQNVVQSSGLGAVHPQTPSAHPSPGRPQTVPQAPQLVGSVCVSLQRPWSPSQKVAPGSHAHAPPAHVPRPQSTPQAPQLVGSVAYDAGSRQAPAQRSWPEGHASCDGQPAASTTTARRVGRTDARAMRPQ